MEYLVNGKQMKMIDEFTIGVIGVPSMVLMERAAYSVAEQIKNKLSLTDRVLAVCGTGNNGGDGIAAARILFVQGYHAEIMLAGDKEKGSAEFKQQLDIATNLGMNIFNNKVVNEYNIIVDAIFGIGLSKPAAGIYKEIIQWINQNDSIIYSIDIPSGISADTGGVCGAAVRADYTVTFGLYKIGLILYPGAEYAGEVILADIGFPDCTAAKVFPNHYIYDLKDLGRLPVRHNRSNKGTYGKILIIAGSHNMSGACYLSAKAAYRSGAGLVKILTAESNRTSIQTALPEAVLTTYHSTDRLSALEVQEIKASILEASSIVIGPGIGKSETAKQLLELVLDMAEVPVVVDADGLNLLSMQKERYRLEGDLEYLTLPSNILLTPHIKEMERLTGISVKEIRENIIHTGFLASAAGNYPLVLKDARTVVTDGRKVYINVSGNHGMATGGSGDVLTGIIAAFAAGGLPLFEAAALGVYVHGLAGDLAAAGKGHYALMAGDIIEALPKILK